MNIYGTLQTKDNVNGGINVASIGSGGASDFDTKIIPYAERISANEESIENIDVAIENHTEQIANAQDDINYLEEEINLNTQNINDLNQSVNNISQSVNTLSSTVVQNTADIEELKQRPSGGGTLTTIFDNGTSGTSTMILSQSYNDFDYIIIEQANHDDNMNWGCGMWTPNIMNYCKENNANLSIYGVLGGYRNYNVVNDRLINVTGYGNLWIRKLIGVKL